MRSRGFSLLQLLVVLAILGLLFALGSFSLRGLNQRTLVRQSATDLAALLRQARSEAQRYNQNVQFQLVSSTSYTITRGGATRTVNLPSTLALSNAVTSGPTTITYTAPYGEVTPTGMALRLRRTTAATPAVVVGVVGLPGKVVLINE